MLRPDASAPSSGKVSHRCRPCRLYGCPCLSMLAHVMQSETKTIIQPLSEYGFAYGFENGNATIFNKCQCHAEGGATKGGVSKCEQTQTNADKRKQTQRRKCKQTQANASKRGQTQTNAYTPLYCGFLHPSLQSPSNVSCEPHGEGKETCLCPSTDRVQVRLFPSTVWAGREYGLDWFRVRCRYPLRRERVRESRSRPPTPFRMTLKESIWRGVRRRWNCSAKLLGRGQGPIPSRVLESVRRH